MDLSEQTPLQFSCSACKQLLEVPTTLAGAECECPYCQAVVRVPAQSVPLRPIPIQPEPTQAPIQPEPTQPAAVVLRDQPANLPPVRTSQPQAAPNLPPVKTAQPQSDSGFPQIDTGSAGIASEYSQKCAVEEPRGAFAPEKRGLQAGVLGGVAMMLIAAVWFIVGLANNILFYYPPVLFVIGLFGFIHGLATGNFAGNKRRRRRY